jgi:hypothetical protein
MTTRTLSALVKIANGQPLKVLELQGSLNNENGLR